jgi:hypothetical protein
MHSVFVLKLGVTAGIRTPTPVDVRLLGHRLTHGPVGNGTEKPIKSSLNFSPPARKAKAMVVCTRRSTCTGLPHDTSSLTHLPHGVVPRRRCPHPAPQLQPGRGLPPRRALHHSPIPATALHPAQPPPDCRVIALWGRALPLRRDLAHRREQSRHGCCRAQRQPPGHH